MSISCQIGAKYTFPQLDASSKLTFHWLVHSLELLVPSIQATVKQKTISMIDYYCKTRCANYEGCNLNEIVR